MTDIGTLVGAIDQGTSSTRFIVFSATNGIVVTYHQVEVKRFYPREGWVEQDPDELYNSVLQTCDVVYQKLKQLKIDPKQLKCIGLTNQRESTIVWDRFTGNEFLFQFRLANVSPVVFFFFIRPTIVQLYCLA